MSNCEGSRVTPESSQARMTLVEALRYHASLMIAPEVDPKVRALLNDASTVMWAAAEALSTESESVALVHNAPRNDILEEAALAIENADATFLEEVGAALLVRSLKVTT